MHSQPAAADTGDLGGGGALAPQTGPEPLRTVPLQLGVHRIGDFRCSRSENVQGFFGKPLQRFLKYGYCKVLVWPDPADPTGIWAYYTLSPDGMCPGELLSKSQLKKIPGSLRVPLMRIGYMGRDDRAPAGLGAELLVDAARRVSRSADTTAWAFVLEPEGGLERPALYNWYLRLGFKAIAVADSRTLFCPVDSLLPPGG